MSSNGDVSMIDEEEELKHADDLTLGGLPKLVIVSVRRTSLSPSCLRQASF